ncbi:hypothetical protein [Streptomyces hoynatensis]|nr:hypothetical protein [Streptomyces hoynatensis]
MGISTSGTTGPMGAFAVRLARAGVFAALCVTLSAGAHVLLSGTPVPLPAVALVLGSVFLLALGLAGRHERGYWAIAGLLLPLQLGADTVFTTGQDACYGPGGGPVTGPLRLLGVDLVCGGGDFATPLARLATEGQSALAVHGPAQASPWLLLAVHLAVGLAAAAWLRGGEAALARLLRTAGAVALGPLLRALGAARTLRRPAPAPTPRPGRREPSFALLLLPHSVPRRGPPPVPALAH